MDYCIIMFMAESNVVKFDFISKFVNEFGLKGVCFPTFVTTFGIDLIQDMILV